MATRLEARIDLPSELLAIYPAGDHGERLYAVGKIANDVQPSVQLHEKAAAGDFYAS